LPDGLSEIFLRKGLDKGFRKSGSDLPVEAGQEFVCLQMPENFYAVCWPNYLKTSATNLAKALGGNCLLRVREVSEFLPSLDGQIRRSILA
jgi:hypothetical protein